MSDRLHANERRTWSVIGLTVTTMALEIVSGLLFGSMALLLKEHPHDSDADHHDHNLRAAYLHVLADATASILAILALAFGMMLGRSFLDPVTGIAGALLISHWSYGLMREAGGVLLDRTPEEHLVQSI